MLAFCLASRQTSAAPALPTAQEMTRGVVSRPAAGSLLPFLLPWLGERATRGGGLGSKAKKEGDSSHSPSITLAGSLLSSPLGACKKKGGRDKMPSAEGATRVSPPQKNPPSLLGLHKIFFGGGVSRGSQGPSHFLGACMDLLGGGGAAEIC